MPGIETTELNDFRRRVYVATYGDPPESAQLHLLSAGRVAAGPAELRIDTEYPWDGRVVITVERGAGEWELAVRVPAWSDGARLDGEPVEPGYARLRRTWSDRDRVVLELPMPVHAVAAHPRVDAVRGCVALMTRAGRGAGRAPRPHAPRA